MRPSTVVLVLLLAALTCNAAPGKKVAEARSDIDQSRSKRSLLNFGGMIACAIPNVGNPVTAALRYTNYGCWCGVGGSGPTVDNIDACCKVHDACYDAAINRGCSNPKFEGYHWNCDGGDPTCDSTWWQRFLTGENTRCEKEICKCDLEAVACFSAHNHAYDSGNIAYIDRSHC
ncbi:basic phospholipase A2 PA-12A-like [Sycon ciliatum]|uniref:basic phospholipase A2 PA-12A-like n=1 Tax=Sycon ciliatum TaxID=27933 RepID=UPI0031F6CDD4